jgi:hypothetical protein
MNLYLKVECADAAMKQLLLHLDEKLPPDKKFILHDLDETHVFIVRKNLKNLFSLLPHLKFF